MNFEHHILRILMEAGSNGLTVAKLARHVHGQVNTLFNAIDYAAVHRAVGQYLNRESRTTGGTVVRTRHGVYTLNPQASQQLMFDFRETADVDERQAPPAIDLSLDLFADISPEEK